MPPDIAERTRRRVFWRLIPFLIVIYVLAYIDRTNIGVAKLKMQPALGFDDATTGFGAGIFFIGYCLLEIPGALIVERWSARRWIARIMISWGLAAAAMGFIGTPVFGATDPRHQFYALRFVLGAAEAGFFPGVIIYLSHWFPAAERTRVKAWFLIAQPIAVMTGLPLGRAILETVDWLGLDGWRWLFILEGLPAAALGVVVLFYLTDRPEQARWLAPEEREWLAAQLAAGAADTGKRAAILDAFRDRRVVLLACVGFLIVSGNQAMVFFLPSIMEGLGTMSTVTRTALTMVPYLLAMCGILLAGYSSQRTGDRRWHMAVPMLLNGLGLSLAILSQGSPWLAIAFFCLCGLVAQAYMPAMWSLPTELLGKSAAATAVGFINTVANLGGFFGPSMFGSLRTSTGGFDAGLWFLVGCMVTAGVFATRLRIPRRVSGSPVPA